MEKGRYVIVEKSGKASVVKKDDSRYVGIDEMAQHIAIDIIEDYANIVNGDKKIEETNIELSIRVLTAISPFRSDSVYGTD